MLRLLPLSRSLPRSSRGLVSSALLSKARENDSISIAELRAEAKRRGLSAGTKVALASRLEEYEKAMSTTVNIAGHEPSSLSSSPTSSKNNVLMALRAEKPAVNMAGTRELSSLSSLPSSPTANPTKAPGNPEPPVVPMAPYRLDINLPDLSQPTPLPPVQPPYVPDFWDSSSRPVPVVEEEALPKMVVVGGAATHHGGGPTHSSLDLDTTEENVPTPQTERSDSFLDDIAEDLGLPPIADKFKKGISSFLN